MEVYLEQVGGWHIVRYDSLRGDVPMFYLRAVADGRMDRKHYWAIGPARRRAKTVAA